ncbi:MAG: nucleotidyltransferase domain-containing protein, partial [Pseudomonadota bacterium]
MESPENYSFDGDCTIADFKTALADVRANLDQARLNGLSPSKLLQNHSKFIDSLLVNAWRHFFEAVPPSQAQELIAVGGYGRQELHPYSDIDLLVLLPKIASEHQERQIEAFIRFLWDIGLEVGHSTRAIKDCIEWARKDITVVTNLTEARLIEGSGKLLLRLHEHIGPNKMWS